MTITALPSAPSRADPADFATRGDALMTALPTFVIEANALQADVNAAQVEASAAAQQATVQAGLASAQVVLARQQAELSSAAANFKGLWIARTGALSMPASVYHLGVFWALNQALSDVTSATPGISPRWTEIVGSTKGVVSADFTMPSTVATGGSLVLALSGTSALVGGSVASFEVTDWNAAVTTTAATSNAASKTLTASTTIGQVLSVSVVAIDNYGNRSLPVVKTSTVVSVSINAVTITSPANAATGITATPTISGNSFGVTNGTDTQISADWEIWTGANRTGTLVWSSINNTVNKTSITVPAATLVINTVYYIAARYKGTTYGYGDYGYCSFTTATSFVPSTAGAAYQGGFYAGKIVVSGLTYALVVAPKASGEYISKQWKATNDTTAGTLSVNDGLSNSNAMINASHPAAQFCRTLTIGGYSDWYLPAKDELEILYRFFKPASMANNTSSGANSNSLPVGAAYTASNPTTSVLLAYTTGNAEAFAAEYYWSSTEFTASNAWGQFFGNGDQYDRFKYSNFYVRAVRKVLI